ncbi:MULTISPECIES: TonB-dependent receptor [Pseudoalteromonas]|jgi:iron complex outermembrane receptor protein|uniref:Iron complex outermembrane recepter protein n=1 Tax=Pseudoalteromonas aliena SW19 TaxID=1314866 RepID=A0ABR9E3T5_9GAMM|nr:MULTISPECIES: TonB-dependent receptor [Pseudoalteromonas]MBE0361248.1 iron complex outermembrane recepter protein [Pseudoalteromonas aliena SW19]TMN95547.1 TonB-dependent receptor [Pseudoalteromonas sp. S558]
MSKSIFKKGMLASSIALILTSGTSAMAAEQVSSVAESDIEVIEVKGIRSSLKENINAKRFSSNVSDVITSEDIGKFPDKNVAETLSRITGVAVSREFGEGEKVSIRGAGPKYNRTLLNGQTVGTADWFILDEANRSFNYTMLPSVIVKSLEVNKSPVASIDEGSIGGTIVLRTRRPLEMDANSVSLSLEGQYSETSEETDPQLAGMYSWKNEDESFGVMVSAVKQERNLERQGFEVLGWVESADDKYSVPRNIGAPKFVQSRERETIFATLQYAPTDSLLMTLNYLDSKMDVDNQNSNLINFAFGDRAEIIANATKIENGAILASSAGGNYAYNFINRVSSTQTDQLHLDVDYQGDGYSLNVELGRTEAKGGTYRETSWEYVAVGAGYEYDLTGTPNVNVGVNPADGNNFAAGWIWGGAKPTTDEETFAQADLTFDVEFGPFTAIKTGVKYRQAERTQGRHAYSWHAPFADGGPDSDHYLDHIFDSCPTLAACGLDANGAISIDAGVTGNITQQVSHNRGLMEDIAFNGLNGVSAAYAIHDNLAEIWEVKEDILALYVQGDFSGDGYRGNVGLRHVSTDQTSYGYEFSGDSWGLNTINGDWLTPKVLNWVSQDNDYSEFLPSFNIAFDLTDEQVFRVGAARVMARQNWADISSSETFGSLTGGRGTGSRGNPNLAPTIANQFDLSWEWYYDDASMLSVAYFAKDLSSLRSTVTVTEDRYDQENDVFVPVDFAQPGNGLGGSIQGIELGLQHDFGGFGVSANYTYTDASADEERDISKAGTGLVEGTSKNMLNLMAFYENDDYQARIMYNFRSDWYKGLHFNGDELFNDSFGQWDASASYNVNQYVTLTLEAVNLTDEEIVEYNTNEERIMSIYSNGRRYVAGIRVNF